MQFIIKHYIVDEWLLSLLLEIDFSFRISPLLRG